jgi:heterodisulfide reductase subunit C
MPNWGYTVNKDNQVDFDRNNREILSKILSDEPSFDLCIACGSCAGTCSAANFTTFSLRLVNVLIARGETNSLKEEIAKCMLCGKCTLVCPRGVNMRNVILTIKREISDFSNFTNNKRAS